MKKKVIGVSMAPAARQYGNAYAGHVFFGSQGLGRQINPVVQLDHVSPAQPSTAGGTTEAQALRGCEIVTLVTRGSVQARDSAGHQVTLQKGDVQWLTAGSGLIRQEMVQGGEPLELTHVLVNLPAQYKMTPPHNQHLESAAIPEVTLPEGAGTLRVIAGEYEGKLGPAETVGPLQLWSIDLRKGHSANLNLPMSWYAVTLVLDGRLEANYWPHPITERQLVVIDRVGDEVLLTAWEDTRLILVSAEPLEEAVTGEEGLVLNSPEELAQTRLDLEAGQFGTL